MENMHTDVEGVKGKGACSSFCPLLAGLHFNQIIWKGCLHITSLWKKELILREVTYENECSLLPDWQGWFTPPSK